MNTWIGLGSNLGERRENLEKAAALLLQKTGSASFKAAPIVQSPALVPAGAPADWNRPFLNSVLTLRWDGGAADLLALLKQVEAECGRSIAPRWAPRVIDLDLLRLGDQILRSTQLQVPHPEMANRSFVLTPLKHLAGSQVIPGCKGSILRHARARKDALPLWMGIVNLTPDSFSEDDPAGTALDKLNEFSREDVHIVDLGAESTRPGATPLTPEQEWKRLAPAMDWWQARQRERIFRPLLSVDTYHAETAARAIAMGADIINDVSGLSQPAMLEVLAGCDAQYVLMHSLGVPADPKRTLKVSDPVFDLNIWANDRLQALQAAGVALDRVIFDPGIGFGKTAAQSWAIVKGIERFFELPVRILAGHSRKSFLQSLREGGAAGRDPETLGLSLNLAARGVDILRVHDPVASQRAFQAFNGGLP